MNFEFDVAIEEEIVLLEKNIIRHKAKIKRDRDIIKAYKKKLSIWKLRMKSREHEE